MANLALIPARAGSKRIPGKNKRTFLGKPVILYSVEAAIDSRLFDEVVVFSDDPEINKITSEAGATTSFQRSARNADDQATLTDVVLEAVALLELNSRHYEYICLILPTAPLLSKKSLLDAYNLMLEQSFSSIIPVTKFTFPIQRALRLSPDKSLSFFHPEYIYARSQDLSPAYHDAGQFYWIKTKDFTEEKSIFMKHSGSIELDEYQVQDIDNEVDWILAELKYSFLQKLQEGNET